MKKIIIFIISLFSIFGLQVNYSYAQTDAEALKDIFSGLFNIDDIDSPTEKTIKELAREHLVSFPNGEKYANLIDNLIEKNKNDSVKLNRIYGKVKNFDLSKYNSPVPGKNATLAAVISYIKASLEEILNIN